jgi:hypothetical protein
VGRVPARVIPLRSNAVAFTRYGPLLRATAAGPKASITIARRNDFIGNSSPLVIVPGPLYRAQKRGSRRGSGTPPEALARAGRPENLLPISDVNAVLATQMELRLNRKTPVIMRAPG